MKWFRTYYSILDSVKVRGMPERAQLTYFYLLCLAAEYRDRTSTNTGQTGVDVSAAAWRIRDPHMARYWRFIEEAGLAHIDADGHIVVNDWENKQMQSDDVAMTKRKQRALSMDMSTSCPPLEESRLEEKRIDQEQKEKNQKKKPPADAGSPRVSLKTFLDRLKESGERFCPDDDPIRKRAADLKLPNGSLEACFHQFRELHIGNGKLQKDWRAVFRNCVIRNWYRLWTVDQLTGGTVLTAAGKLAVAALRADMETDDA